VILRNAWIVFSCLVIALCLSLFFQADDGAKNVAWDQYKILNYGEEQSHSLTDLNQKISPQNLEKILSDILSQNQLAGEKTRVMEIGTGNGRVLMELKKKFPQIEFYGINKEKTHTFFRRESFILTALKFNIFTKEDLEHTELPFIIFTDLDFGHKIPYDNDKFDLIFSQNTMSFIRYKFELWNEILRILKPSGISIHTDVVGLKIYQNGVIIDTRDAFVEMKRKGLSIQQLENPYSIMFTKDEGLLRFFPVQPHQKIPDNQDLIPQEQSVPDMGYNLAQ